MVSLICSSTSFLGHLPGRYKRSWDGQVLRSHLYLARVVKEENYAYHLAPTQLQENNIRGSPNLMGFDQFDKLPQPKAASFRGTIYLP